MHHSRSHCAGFVSLILEGAFKTIFLIIKRNTIIILIIKRNTIIILIIKRNKIIILILKRNKIIFIVTCDEIRRHSKWLSLGDINIRRDV
jgi:hypothetical protein